MFSAAETAEQPDSKDCSEYVLNEGSFQIPLHRTGLKQGQPLTASALDSSPIRPCSSVLIRIVRAQRAQDGVQVLTSKDIDVGEDELERLKLLIRPKPYHVGEYASHRYTSATLTFLSSYILLSTQKSHRIVRSNGPFITCPTKLFRAWARSKVARFCLLALQVSTDAHGAVSISCQAGKREEITYCDIRGCQVRQGP